MADEAKPAAAEQPAAATPQQSADKPPVDGSKPTIAIKIYAPFKVYFEGAGYSLSAINASGPFDILPHHHNFLCMLLPCDLIVRTPYETKVIKVSRALMHVKADKVTVFVDV